MERIFSLLDKLKIQYALCIGGKSVNDLCTFVSGYECAIRDLTGERIRFDALFQNYVENTLQAWSEGKHWDHLLTDIFCPIDAFDKFYQLLESFKIAYQNSDLSVFFNSSSFLEKQNQGLYKLMYITTEGIYLYLGSYNSKESVRNALVSYRANEQYYCTPSCFIIV